MSLKQTETIDSKLKKTWQMVSRMYNSEAERHNLTIAMGHYLLNIDSLNGTFATDLAPKLGTESTSLSRISASLEDQKLIARIPDKVDKRKIKIKLTAKGKKSKDLTKSVVKEFNEFVVSKIGKNKIEELFNTLDLIYEIAEQRNSQIKNK